ncbi:hypothetical protein SKAU_G00013290 [Synaphobranchus kaupii]|uniref:Uncharacterized protein n=1 Tax=Synaphobranchus kaupii TaxID=118154 RepID=A0A9Q1GAF4_SYNKA|nr:hypothetical protein SKAU_G00013290 [Synaphobranchus kaupii]
MLHILNNYENQKAAGLEKISAVLQTQKKRGGMDWRGDFPQDHAFVDCGIVGLPGDPDVQQLLRDTEEKLKLNACSIEQSLKELQVKLGDSWTGDKASTPTDCLQWFSPRNLTLLKPTCTGHQQLLEFLRALQQFLRTEEKGREEATLQLLLDISSQCGVAFPSPAPLTALHLASGSPVHVVREEAALEVREVWEDVRLLLRRHLLDELQSAADPEGGGSEACVSQRVQRLQQLLFLYPEAEVLTRYRSVRVKAVQDLLQSARSSSAPETGFDRAAGGFRTAAPALLRMVGEDLRALSAVVEPAAVLAFINQALLGTRRARAARSHGEAGGKRRKGQQHEQRQGQEVLRQVQSSGRDPPSWRSAPGAPPRADQDPNMKGAEAEACAKGLDRGHRRGAGVGAKRDREAPQEEDPRRGQRFCLTSHQLRQLTLLAGVLLDLEERVEELAADLGFLCCAGETPCSVRGILKKARDDLETTLRESSRSATETVLPVPEATVLEFDWRAAFRELAPPMSHCVKVLMEDVCAKSLRREEAARASGSAVLALTDVPQAEGPPASCPGSEPPKMIAKFAGDILEELDTLSPLALACRDDSLLDVRASFVEVVGKVTLAVLRRLQERGREVPASAPLRNLPALLATGLYLQQRLSHYAARLKDPTRMSPSPLPVQKCQELAEALQEHLTAYCVQACSTCILQDPESHHWGDPKPFYEGERCSFAIQMWHYFLSGLRSDLWAILPPGLAQEVLAQVLSQTLEVLVRRYSQACPSYKRTQQIRTDITAILLCVEQLMWSVCGSAEALVRPGSWDEPWTSSVHSLCSQLLGVLVIVTSPLSALYKNFCRDPADEPPPSPTKMPACNQRARWLRHINPSLFSEEPVRMSAADELAVVGRLRLLCAQPGCSYKLLLRALLQSDCILLQVLLSHSRFCADDGAEDSAEIWRDEDAFLEAVFSVLSTLNCVPKALALVFEGYFDKRHLWDRLYNLAVPDSRQAEPAVLRCLRATVTESIVSIVGNIVAMVTSWQVTEDHATPLSTQIVPESVLSKVPKEWNYTSQNPQGKESANDCTSLLLQAVSFVFANLPSAVASLPLPVRFLFHAGEKRLSQNSRQLKPTGLLLWGLLGSLCRSLEDGSDRPLARGGKEKLTLVAECLQAAMGLEKGVPKPVVHKVLQTLEERRPKWSSVQLQAARKLCAEGAFEAAESGGVAPERGSVPELTEQKIGLTVLEMCHKAGGGEYLRQIYHIIQLNEELLASRLAAPTDPAQAGPQAPAANLSRGPAGPRPPFDPIAQFSRIGGKEFDQSAISEWSWDWAQLLPSYQGMSQVTLRALLANRWDLQDAAPLEDEERALADLLRKTYFSAGPRS